MMPAGDSSGWRSSLGWYGTPVQRRVLLGAAAALGITAAGGLILRDGGTPDAEATWQGAPQQWSGSFLQVVAHPDDDLFFMNPDLCRGITAGSPLVTVVLTAAEGDGRNIDTAAGGRDEVRVDYAGYSAARHNGLRAAYSLMASGDASGRWSREAVELGGGLVVERATLVADPRVLLYFFNVRKFMDDAEGLNFGLDALWTGVASSATTLPATGSPVGRTQTVTRQSLVAAVLSLLDEHQPSTVRVMDPDPEHDAGRNGLVSSDHRDHTGAALFTVAALARYRRGDRPPAVEHYRAYANRFWPYNLSPAAHEEKRKYLLTYAGADGTPCPAHDCGDYQVGPEPYRSTHIFSTAYRYRSTANWLALDATGRLLAFAVLNGRLGCWTEQSPGSGRWSGPSFLDGEWISPAVAVAAGGDGRVHVVGLRRSLQPGRQVSVEIVRTVRADGAFQPWRSLAGPDWRSPERRREVGVPAATVDTEGRLHVFVRNFGQGLSWRAERGPGDWSDWQDLGGSRLQDAPVAITTSTGRLEVYAPDKERIIRWWQPLPDQGMRQDDSLRPPPVATGGLTATESDPGRVTLYYRGAGTARVLAYQQRPDLAGWASTPDDLGGHEGTGAVAVLGRGGSVLLAHRNGAGSVAVAAQPASGAPPQWTDSGGPVVGAPALAADRDGRAVLAVVGVDGRLHVRRQRDSDPASPLGPWQTI
jgi:LmbE family N-acetylglucosaminyl deacetylase